MQAFGFPLCQRFRSYSDIPLFIPCSFVTLLLAKVWSWCEEKAILLQPSWSALTFRVCWPFLWSARVCSFFYWRLHEAFSLLTPVNFILPCTWFEGCCSHSSISQVPKTSYASLASSLSSADDFLPWSALVLHLAVRPSLSNLWLPSVAIATHSYSLIACLFPVWILHPFPRFSLPGLSYLASTRKSLLQFLCWLISAYRTCYDIFSFLVWVNRSMTLFA